VASRRPSGSSFLRFFSGSASAPSPPCARFFDSSVTTTLFVDCERTTIGTPAGEIAGGGRVAEDEEDEDEEEEEEEEEREEEEEIGGSLKNELFNIVEEEGRDGDRQREDEEEDEEDEKEEEEEDEEDEEEEDGECDNCGEDGRE
jgi:hypothetical protein